MKKSLIRSVSIVTLMSLLTACGGSKSPEPIEKEKVEIPDTETPGTEVPDTEVPDKPILTEILNGSFEEDTAGQISPVGNWLFRPSHEAPAFSTIQVIESEEGVNSYKGTKAVEVNVDTIGDNPWSVEIIYDNILFEGGKTYEFSVWVKGAAGTSADFYILTSPPAFEVFSSASPSLTGEWQEIKMVTTLEADTVLIPVIIENA